MTAQNAASGAIFDRWRQEIAPVFDVQPLSAEVGATFHGSISRHHLGVALVGQVATSAQRYERNENLIGAVGVDHLLIQVYQAGRTTLEIDGREVKAGPADVLVFDLSRPVLSHATDMRAVNLILPRNLLGLDTAALDRAHGMVLRGQDGLGRLAGDHLRALLRAAPNLSSQEGAGLAKASAGLLAACLAPALGRGREAPATIVAPMITICHFIDRHIADPTLGADGLGREFGLSRSALYRLFEPLGGVSEYIRRRRLDRARLALNSTAIERGGIGRIARRFGFSSDEAFSRAFKARFGTAPRDAARIRCLVQTQHEDDSLDAWLRRLVS